MGECRPWLCLVTTEFSFACLLIANTLKIRRHPIKNSEVGLLFTKLEGLETEVPCPTRQNQIQLGKVCPALGVGAYPVTLSYGRTARRSYPSEPSRDGWATRKCLIQ